jgi:hypothetical protein
MSDAIRRELSRALRERMKANGWSVAHLADLSGVKCSRASLHRKIFGVVDKASGKRVYQTLSDDECRRLARIVDMRLVDAHLEGAA